jgi:hypothetical protein
LLLLIVKPVRLRKGRNSYGLVVKHVETGAKRFCCKEQNTSRPETATRDELNKRILSLEVQLEKANERAKSDNPLTSAISEATVNRLTNDIIKLQDRLDAIGKSTRTSERAPGSKLEDKGPARSSS